MRCKLCSIPAGAVEAANTSKAGLVEQLRGAQQAAELAAERQKLLMAQAEQVRGHTAVRQQCMGPVRGIAY